MFIILSPAKNVEDRYIYAKSYGNFPFDLHGYETDFPILGVGARVGENISYKTHLFLVLKFHTSMV
jgi:hypothetical protein